jgi:hypothetical protein
MSSRWVGHASSSSLWAARPAWSSMTSVRHDPAHQRERVRSWLVDLLAAEGVAITLQAPRDSRWDDGRRRYSP